MFEMCPAESFYSSSDSRRGCRRQICASIPGRARARMASLPSIVHRGGAKATDVGRRSAKAAFDNFLAYQRSHAEYAQWPGKMDDLTEEQANDKSLFERFAHWLVYHSKGRGLDTSLKPGTIRDYIRGVGQQLMDVHGKTPGSSLSFLGGPNNWLSGIVNAVEVLFVQKAMAEGGNVSRRTHEEHRSAVPPPML